MNDKEFLNELIESIQHMKVSADSNVEESTAMTDSRGLVNKKLDECIDEILVILSDPDIVRVTRCKDCQFAWMTVSGQCKYCDLDGEDGFLHEHYYDGEHYCEFGRRKEAP